MSERDLGYQPHHDNGNELPDFDMSMFVPPHEKTIASLNARFDLLKNESQQDEKYFRDKAGKPFFFIKRVFRSESQDTAFSYVYQYASESFWPAADQLEQSGEPFTIHSLYYSSPEIIMSYDTYYNNDNTLLLLIDKTAQHNKPPTPLPINVPHAAATGAAIRNDYMFAGTKFETEYNETRLVREQAHQAGADIPVEATMQLLIEIIDQQLEA